MFGLELGAEWLRNGFRFSSYDRTTLDKTINKMDDNSIFVPLGAMFDVKYSSKDDENENEIDKKIKAKAELFVGGSLTKNLSFLTKAKKLFKFICKQILKMISMLQEQVKRSPQLAHKSLFLNSLVLFFVGHD